MKIDDIKKEFIQFMEKVHTQYAYPKNFFACLMAILIEQHPITQDRIMELTRCSRTTVSQLLTQIQMNLPIKQVRIPGKRNKFYEYTSEPTDFMIDIFISNLESEEFKVDYIPPIIEEISPYSEKHPIFSNFKHFLETLYHHFSLYFDVLSKSREEFISIIKADKAVISKLKEYNKMQPEKIAKILKSQEIESDEPKSEMDPELFKTYIQFKRKYFQKIREVIGPLRSQKATYYVIIFQNILIEQEPITQEEIQDSTGYQRSIISDTLQILIQQGLVKVFRKPGDLKKYYQNTISGDQMVFNRFKRVSGYTKTVKTKIDSLIEQLKNFKDDSSEYQSTKTFFEKMYQAYDNAEQYIEALEIKFLSRFSKNYLTKDQ
ncbi:MAG: hypothetical protein ACFFBD_29300 [Candidatus Hodarchaeota archaeon]